METYSLSSLTGQSKSNNDRPKRKRNLPSDFRNKVLEVIDDVNYSPPKKRLVFIQLDGSINYELPNSKTREQCILDNNISILKISDRDKDKLKENGIYFLKDFQNHKNSLDPALRKKTDDYIKYLLRNQDVVTDDLEEEEEEDDYDDDEETEDDAKKEESEYEPSAEEEEEESSDDEDLPEEVEEEDEDEEEVEEEEEEENEEEDDDEEEEEDDDEEDEEEYDDDDA